MSYTSVWVIDWRNRCSFGRVCCLWSPLRWCWWWGGLRKRIRYPIFHLFLRLVLFFGEFAQLGCLKRSITHYITIFMKKCLNVDQWSWRFEWHYFLWFMDRLSTFSWPSLWTISITWPEIGPFWVPTISTSLCVCGASTTLTPEVESNIWTWSLC